MPAVGREAGQNLSTSHNRQHLSPGPQPECSAWITTDTSVKMPVRIVIGYWGMNPLFASFLYPKLLPE